MIHKHPISSSFSSCIPAKLKSINVFFLSEWYLKNISMLLIQVVDCFVLTIFTSKHSSRMFTNRNNAASTSLFILQMQHSLNQSPLASPIYTTTDAPQSKQHTPFASTQPEYRTTRWVQIQSWPLHHSLYNCHSIYICSVSSDHTQTILRAWGEHACRRKTRQTLTVIVKLVHCIMHRFCYSGTSQ